MKAFKKLGVLTAALLLVLTSLFSLAGCGGAKKRDRLTVDEQGNVEGTLTIWGGSAPFHDNYAVGSIPGNNYDPDCNATVRMLDMIKEKYPKVNIVIENKGGGTDLNTALRNAKQSNNMPDIVVGEQFIKPQIEEYDYYIPLEIPTATKNAIPDVLWAQSRGKDGKQYGYPAMTGCFALIYNKKIFREVYGLAADADVTPYVPSSMDEVVTTAARIKNFYNDKYGSTATSARNKGGFLLNCVAGLGSAYRNGLVMNMFGGGFTDANGNFIVNSDANVNAFKWLTNLIPYTASGNIAITSETDMNTLMLSGNIAMAFEIAPLLAPFQGVSVEDFGVAPLPAVDGQQSANILVGSTSYMVTKECTIPAVAQDILEMMVSYDMQMHIYKNSTNRLPVRNDVYAAILAETEDQEILKKNEMLKPFIEGMLTTENMVEGLPGFSKSYANIWRDWSSAVQKIFTDPKESIIRAQLADIQASMIKG